MHPVYKKALEAKSSGQETIWLDTCDVAKLIRTRLAAAFPGVKFGVRSHKYSGGSSIHIGWTDGPRQKEVQQIANEYRFADFDGMIDLKTDRDNWLLPDGSMALAHTSGTEGSMGYYPRVDTDSPAPAAVLVSGGADFVFAQRDLSDQLRDELASRILAYYGENPIVAYDDRGNLADRHIPAAGEYLHMLIHQFAEGARELPPQTIAATN